MDLSIVSLSFLINKSTINIQYRLFMDRYQNCFTVRRKLMEISITQDNKQQIKVERNLNVSKLQYSQ